MNRRPVAVTIIAWLLMATGALVTDCFDPNHPDTCGVPERSGASEMTGGWVEVRSCAWLHEAQFLASVLAAAGIESTIPNEHTLGVQPLYAVALGGIRVLVRAEDAERAREVLDSTAAETDAGDDGSDRS